MNRERWCCYCGQWYLFVKGEPWCCQARRWSETPAVIERDGTVRQVRP